MHSLAARNGGGRIVSSDRTLWEATPWNAVDVMSDSNNVKMITM